jgi:hypothetical protein
MPDGTQITRAVISQSRRRGAASILAMMFLVIFSSLAAAMAIVAQGNLTTADSHLKINRSISAAETGMNFLIYRLNQITKTVMTTDGLISDDNAPDLWNDVRSDLIFSLASEYHNLAEPYQIGSTMHVGPISVGPGAPTFVATFTPHPILNEDYDGAFYNKPPYSTMDVPVSAAAPLDSTWIRVTVTASDGPANRAISRSLQMDFHMAKRIDFAILSKSRVMIGRNVIIDGTVGSRFVETNLANGHPIQMVSDFVGLDAATLDPLLDAFTGTLITNDIDGDNRINLASATETASIANADSFDTDGDGYITDYDFFLAHYDVNADGRISGIELDTSNNIYTAQLMELIDTFGDPQRPGYNDGFVDASDRYAKIRGQLKILATKADWEVGAAAGAYQDFLAGTIRPDHNEAALTFEADEANVFEFGPQDFDITTMRNMATGDFAQQAADQAANHDPDDATTPSALGEQVFESVPFGSPHPYDHYDRPVYKNMTFSNITIPKGSNALFVNCKFIGVTFIESEVNNTDENYNYAGIQESDGSLKHPDRVADVDGVDVADTKTVANNIRFDGCIFEGSVASDAPLEFTHVRNKIAFTGDTKFIIDDSVNLSDSQKALFKRSTILSPHYSVEMGTFVAPADSKETVELTGTIVAGLIDMRGQIKVTGSIITTFEPVSGTGPVIGDTSPQFNTTLGYFPSSDGDLEGELPVGGIGVIHVRYDPTIPLPDGISGPISIEPIRSTYTEN